MAATTTQKLSLVSKLKADYPQFSFKTDAVCRWSPDSKTVYYISPAENFNQASLLHELAHAILDHKLFETDIELMQKELAAWEYTTEVLAPKYKVKINADRVEEVLESYRHWLHNRSSCPTCHQTGLQTKTNTYRCLNCRCLWRVNDARQCRLQRIKL